MTFTMPSFYVAPPGCGNLVYNVSAAGLDGAINELADPNKLELTLFYDRSLDLSDPNANGSLEHRYLITVTATDTVSASGIIGRKKFSVAV